MRKNNKKIKVARFRLGVRPPVHNKDEYTEEEYKENVSQWREDLAHAIRLAIGASMMLGVNVDAVRDKGLSSSQAVVWPLSSPRHPNDMYVNRAQVALKTIADHPNLAEALAADPGEGSCTHTRMHTVTKRWADRSKRSVCASVCVHVSVRRCDGVCMWLPVSALLYEDVDRAKFLAAIKIKDFLDVEEDITVKHSTSIENQFNKSKNCMGAMNSIELMGATYIWQPADGMDYDEGDRFLATVRQSKPCKPWHSVAWRAAQTCLHITRGSHVWYGSACWCRSPGTTVCQH